MAGFNISDESEMKEVKKRIDFLENELHKAETHEQRFSDELTAALAEYAEATAQAAELDQSELTEQRMIPP